MYDNMLKKCLKHKIVYCTPALYMAGGEERILSLKASYFADKLGYDVTIILTEGAGYPLFYPLSDKIKVINLNINFEDLWTCSFFKKILLYMKKQKRYKRRLAVELMRIRPDITISMMRREINFINDINDGSKKVGEIHVNRAHFRNFEEGDSSLLKKCFSYFWQKSLLKHVKRLDRFVVLTEDDRKSWPELSNVVTIPDMLSFVPKGISPMKEKRILAVGRYCYQKGFDLLLQAWAIVQAQTSEWDLAIFGDGDRRPYQRLVEDLGLDPKRCFLNGRTSDVETEYVNSSLFVLSSRFEGFGLVIVEAMACGIPVVSFNCKYGPASIITDGKDGLLVEKNDVQGLANALLRLINNDEERLVFAKNAKLSVDRYSKVKVGEMWQHLFDSLMNDEEVVL